MFTIPKSDLVLWATFIINDEEVPPKDNFSKIQMEGSSNELLSEDAYFSVLTVQEVTSSDLDIYILLLKSDR